MSFFASRKVKRDILKVDLENPNLDKPLTAKQVLQMFAITNGCSSLETAGLQRTKLDDIPDEIREFFYETTL